MNETIPKEEVTLAHVQMDEAQRAVTRFVNSQHCRDRKDCERALHCLHAVVLSALNAVVNGQMEKLS